MGVESWKAVWTPTLACVAPGPAGDEADARPPVSSPYASAMFAAPASWRAEMRRIGESWSASSTGR